MMSLPLCSVALWSAQTIAQNQNSQPQVLVTPEEPSSYFGLVAGGNSTAGAKERATPTFGLTLGSLVAPELGIGFLGTYYGQSSSGTLFGLPTGSSMKTINLTAQLNYFLGGVHLGGQAGVAISSWSGYVSNLHVGNSTTTMILGPSVGYDFKLGRALSLGGEAHYIFNTTEGRANNLQVLAALKFWQ
jgi:hypothetical protein